MILTCPECATSYFVDDSRIRPGGRVVKCTSCGARWTAMKDAEPEPAPTPETPLQEPEAFVPAAGDDLEIVAVDPTPSAAVRAVRAAPGREAAGKVAVWVGAGVVVALIAAAILFRGQVVRIWPASQGIYGALGLPVSALGLAIEGVSAKPTFQGGRPVLAVTGAIRSLRDEPVTAPPIRINLLDRAGKAVAAKVATPLDGQVPARAVRHFAIVLVDPPASVHDLEVTFETVAGGPAQGARPVHAPLSAGPAAGPAPVDAQPLPRGSPDALAQHD